MVRHSCPGVAKHLRTPFGPGNKDWLEAVAGLVRSVSDEADLEIGTVVVRALGPRQFM